MYRTVVLALTILAGFHASAAWAEDEPQSLLTRITQWKYPDSEMHGATMSDAETVNENGDRVVPSIYCKTVLTTTDPIDKVIAFYTSKLSQKAETTKGGDADDRAAGESGRSVTFHSDSDGRPVAIRIITVNADRASTTLVISRAEGESTTHIAWSQYERFAASPPAR
jgi:hypothetical protein